MADAQDEKDRNPVAVAMEVLDEHRWKSMGVSSVECECGAILYGPGLTQFPADEAFRRHVAVHVVNAVLPPASIDGGEQHG